MTPTDLQDLQAVRAAAEQVIEDHGCRAITPWPIVKSVANYILATIRPDAGEPVTAEWLREVWGFETSGMSYRWVANRVDFFGIILFDSKGAVWIVRELAVANVTTRHQFTQLMAALNIQPRGITPKEGE